MYGMCIYIYGKDISIYTIYIHIYICTLLNIIVIYIIIIIEFTLSKHIQQMCCGYETLSII